MSQTILDQTRLGALADYLRDSGSPFAEITAVVQLKGGQSNPTFRLETGGGPVVLRMRPIGVGPWAHDVRREFKVLSALRGTPVPVPEAYLYCDDESLIGGAFYLMSFVEGRVADDCRLPGFTPAERRAIYKSFVEAFAAVHAIDPSTVGLSDLGKADGFVSRQLKLHTEKFREYRPDGNADFEWLATTLPKHIPPQRRASLIHNDIRMGNVVLHPTEPSVVAILDWEMSSLGDSFADAALLTLPFHFPAGNPQGTFQGADITALGLPTEQDMLAWYCAALGVPRLEHHAFMTALDLFRYASVYAGIEDRFRKGLAASDDAWKYGAQVDPTFRRAREIAEAGLFQTTSIQGVA